MDSEGRVQVTVAWDGSRIRAVRIDSTRPDLAHALLAGRRADEAKALLPRVFSICARAQATALATALDAARGVATHEVRQREMAVLAEAALEYLWRLQIDLPGLLGLRERPEALAQLRRALGREDGTPQNWRHFIGALRAALQDEWAGTSGPFDPADPAAFAEWEACSDAPAARLLRAVRAAPLASIGMAALPSLTENLLHEIGEALEREPGFSRQPTHAAAPAECGARARLAAHPLLHAVATSTSRAYQRILARWLELAETPARLTRLLEAKPAVPWVKGVTLGPGHGIAGVETARGLLVHAVTLAGDRITAYHIVAPTEWNFHPRGALAADLVEVLASDAREVEQRAALAVQSLDPCVPYAVAVERLRNL
jgi:hypothetical protein